MISPGFIALHGNRLEDLRDVVAGWLRANPLSPFDDEVVLVQSNGIAQWLKFALARPPADGGLGICAGLSIELPARFLWRVYRQVLGEAVAGAQSPYAKPALRWRILRLLPGLLDDAAFVPVARYLDDDANLHKRHALALRLADLFDAYQVYRADWLDDWEVGRDLLGDPLRPLPTARPVPADQTWQPALWRALRSDLAAHGIDAGHRGAVHRAFLQRSVGGEGAGLPPRVVVFGLSSLPQQTLEALAALARHSQVILAVLNPCQHYWADIIDERELLRAPRQRQSRKPGMPAAPRFEDLHLHANPLLAAWGRQGRDFIRLLDVFDQPETYRPQFETAGTRIDLFQRPASPGLLGAVQAAILDLEPLPPTRAAVDADDLSLTFHCCHSAQREVEVLHEQLLARFDAAAAAGTPLAPRDVLVMVPDIEVYAPVIEAVFGSLDEHDRRYLPFTVADRTARRADPVVRVAEALFSLPSSRLALSEVLDLLDVPALRARFALSADALPTLRRWIAGSGIRWGLDAGHRGQLGLPAEAQNSWLFGLRRMLLGYLAGAAVSRDGIEPFAEVAGLEADAIGALADFLHALGALLPQLQGVHPPAHWAQRFRAALDAFLEPTSDAEQLSLERIRSAIGDWLAVVEGADFVEPLPLDIARDAVLAGLDEVRISQRFMGGAVSFATLMPMRAIPFRLVAMLGMNDGDYPRVRDDNDFDLLALPGSARPGDRSRRDDDRYLFLEALLSARDALYISWCGRSARDNSARPPSMLVGQLRDYLDRGWCAADGAALLPQLSCEHPLQPFSLRYFQQPQRGHVSYASDWYAARRAAPPDSEPLPPFIPPPRLQGATLSRFLARPVQAFFNQRLGVYFEAATRDADDHERFDIAADADYALCEFILKSALAATTSDADRAVREAVARLRRAGELPLGPMAADWERGLAERMLGVVEDFRQQLADSAPWGGRLADSPSRYGPIEAEPLLLRQRADGSLLQTGWSANALHGKHGLKHYRLLPAWVRHLQAHASGRPVQTWIAAEGGAAILRPLADPQQAADLLAAIAEAWVEGMHRPLPLPRRTSFAWLQGLEKDEVAARSRARACYEPLDDHAWAESDDPYLARAFADFASLERAGFTQWVKLLQPLLDHAEQPL